MIDLTVEMDNWEEAVERWYQCALCAGTSHSDWRLVNGSNCVTVGGMDHDIGECWLLVPKAVARCAGLETDAPVLYICDGLAYECHYRGDLETYNPIQYG